MRGTDGCSNNELLDWVILLFLRKHFRTAPGDAAAAQAQHAVQRSSTSRVMVLAESVAG
jgi:hypothetical protein